MRVDLAGLIKNAAACLDELDSELRDARPRDKEGIDSIQAESYAFQLRELVKHVKELREGKHTLDEFAEFYCLKS